MGVDPETKVLIAPLRQMMEWARGHSLWPLTFGTACCAIEMMTVGSARYDTDRLGIFFRASPRQSDCMIVAGTINLKMAPRMRLLYEQMAAPKYVIAMGSCAVSGGPFADGYNVVQGVDQILPVDLYIPGCPPRPEALIHGLLTLMERCNAGELSAAEKARIAASHPQAGVRVLTPDEAAKADVAEPSLAPSADVPAQSESLPAADDGGAS